MEKPDDCPSSLYNVMQKCWQYEQSNRPTFQQVSEMLEQVQELREEVWKLLQFINFLAVSIMSLRLKIMCRRLPPSCRHNTAERIVASKRARILC